MCVRGIYRSDLYTGSTAQKHHRFLNKIKKAGGASTTDDDDFFDIDEILGTKPGSSSTNNTTSEPTPLDPDNLERTPPSSPRPKIPPISTTKSTPRKESYRGDAIPKSPPRPVSELITGRKSRPRCSKRVNPNASGENSTKCWIVPMSYCTLSTRGTFPGRGVGWWSLILRNTPNTNI